MVRKKKGSKKEHIFSPYSSDYRRPFSRLLIKEEVLNSLTVPPPLLLPALEDSLTIGACLLSHQKDKFKTQNKKKG